MICSRGSTSQSTRTAARIANCTARTVRRLFRSRRSHSRYCGLMPATRTASAFDMDIELLPESTEIVIELWRFTRRQRRKPFALCRGKADRVIGFHLPGPPRHHDDALRHADRLADIVRHQDHGFLLAPQYFGDLIG